MENNLNQTSQKTFQWAIVGAGPAGIAAVAKLLDNGVSPDTILWVDPYFKVGDLGLHWQNVSSNTKVKLFNDFLMDSPSFSYKNAPANFKLSQLPAEETCTLKYIVEPLQWVSDQLRKKVETQKALITKMHLSERTWFLGTDSQSFKAQNVILATGASPSKLNYTDIDVIPFETAIDKEKLASIVKKDETYGVFGSSHSAIIIVRHLVDLGVKKVINFYRSPCRYAIELDDYILFDNTGLKGHTAAWARKHIDGVLPPNLIRCNTNQQDISQYLPQCNKIVYAVGFEKRHDIVIDDYENAQHNPHVGIIGPGLFGLGIAHPEVKADPLGSVEPQVGLWKFMVYLNKVMPTWLKYHT